MIKTGWSYVTVTIAIISEALVARKLQWQAIYRTPFYDMQSHGCFIPSLRFVTTPCLDQLIQARTLLFLFLNHSSLIIIRPTDISDEGSRLSAQDRANLQPTSSRPNRHEVSYSSNHHCGTLRGAWCVVFSCIFCAEGELIIHLPHFTWICTFFEGRFGQ